MEFWQDPISLSLFAAACVAAIVALRPKQRRDALLILLGIMVFALPRAGVFVGFVRLPLPFAHILTAVCVTAWLVRPRHFQHRSRLHLFFFAYALAACWGLLLGMATGGNAIIAFIEVSFYLFSIGLFFYVSETFGQQRHFLLFINVLLIAAFAVSLYGIAQQYLGDGVLINRITYNSATSKARAYVANSPEARRVLSSYGDPNVLASQLVVFCGVALAIVVAAGVKFTHRLLWLAAGALCTICILFTHSRAALFGLACVTFIILVWRVRWILLLFLVGVTAVAFFMLDMPTAEITEVILPANDLRWKFTGWAWDFICGVPFGCGFGNSVRVQVHEAIWSFAVVPAHSIWMGFNSFWLDLLSRLGIPGIVTFALLLVALFRHVWRLSRTANNPLVRAVIIGSLAGLTAQSLIWLANNTYILPGGSVNYWFTMGMIYAGGHAFTAAKPVVLVPTEMELPLQPNWAHLHLDYGKSNI